MIPTVRNKTDLQKATRNWRATGLTIGFVPTMGALHEGHLSLVKIALENADRCVVSIFVNPTQFGPFEDFNSYPRQEKKDFELLKRAGAHLVYTPSTQEIYPTGAASSVKAGPAAQGLESDFRPHFFDGVATVVHTLFEQVKPDIAVFGEKDYQQLCVIREMVKERNMPIQILSGPTIRDKEGLALSSRNAYFSPEQLKQAQKLNKILFETAAQISSLPSSSRWHLREAEISTNGIQKRQQAKPADLMDPRCLNQPTADRGDDTLEKILNKGKNMILSAGFEEVQYLEMRDGRLLVAAKLAGVRLIDNVPIE